MRPRRTSPSCSKPLGGFRRRPRDMNRRATIRWHRKPIAAYMQLGIAQVGWLRAVLLGRAEEARKLMQRIVELQPGAVEVAQSFLSAHDPEEARFAALFVILRIPLPVPSLGSPDYPTPNFAAPHYVGARCWYYGKPQPQQRSPMNLRFLTSDQRRAAEAEAKQIR